MKKIFFTILCFGTAIFHPILNADEWTDISPPSGFGNSIYTSNCCFDTATDHIYFLWWDSTSSSLRAAYYDFDAELWHDVSPSPSITDVTSLINNCYDRLNHRIYATYHTSTNQVGVAYFDGSGWTSFSPLSSDVDSSVSCCYDSDDQRIYLTWFNTSDEFQAAYYDGNAWQLIPDASMSGSGTVSCCYNSDERRVYAMWVNAALDLSSAYYDGSWHPLPNPGFSNLLDNSAGIQCCYDALHHRIYASWLIQPTYELQIAYYDGSSWQIDYSTTSVLGLFIGCCWNSMNGQVYITWPQPSFGAAVSENGTWPSISPSTNFGFGGWGVYCCYDATNNRIYASGIGPGITGDIKAAVYTFTNSTFTMSGIQQVNDFAVVREIYNSLSWQNPSPSTAGYQLQRNGVLIAALSRDATSYEDHNRIKSVANTYLLSAIDAQGNVLATANLTIQ